MKGNRVIFVGGVLLLILTTLWGCNSAQTRPSQKWPALIEKKLTGVWVSDKFGKLYISCDGFIHMDDQGGFDLGNTGLKNAKIVEILPNELLIETMPFVKDHFSMEQFPVENAGVLKMKFWGREWKATESWTCESSGS